MHKFFTVCSVCLILVMMMKVAMLLCVVAVMLLVVEARSPLGIVYPFPLDTILHCRQADPNAPDGISEVPTPTVPIVPGEYDEVWLPEEVRFRPPRGTIDGPWLAQKLREAGFRPGVHFLDCDDNDVSPPPGSGDIPPSVDVIMTSEADLGGFNVTEQNAIRRFWNRVGFVGAGCSEPIYEKTQLPDYYYPPCYTGGRCSGRPCSLPEGQHCIPSMRNTIELPVYRWDCCWDFNGAVWRWACGFYLVNIQIITQCYCSCRPVLDLI